MNRIIAVDFDGTLCEDKWPDIGEPNFELIAYLLGEQLKGTQIILWTSRGEERLEKALEWCEDRGLIFDAVNENLPEVIEAFGGDTRKIYADEYIDDKFCTKFKLPFVPHSEILDKRFNVVGNKFKTPEALLQAYESLEKEFTKRCQRVKELEKELIFKEQGGKE
jgi:hypothetical protein